MQSAVHIQGLSKTYKSGYQALRAVDLRIARGEIFALLGPNGAGKTTLIGIVCGLVRPSSGCVTVNGFDVLTHYRQARAEIGLVPQELSTDMFETVWNTVSFSRGLFGKKPDPSHIERVLRDLSLWDKRHSRIATLSGGMKRRVLIAKALAHEPKVLFLDEPTAGVDVALRRDMWALVRRLRDQGVTIILTTHYIEEAEDMADRIGVIDRGEIVLVQDKAAMLREFGQTRVTIGLGQALTALPPDLAPDLVTLSADGHEISFLQGGVAMTDILKRLADAGIGIKTINTARSSLEDIFVDLIRKRA